MKINITKTLQRLKANGYRVNITHFREVHIPEKNIPKPKLVSILDINSGNLSTLDRFRPTLEYEISQKGGVTVLKITTPSGKQLKSTATVSKKDNFSRKHGVRVALGRVLHELARTDCVDKLPAGILL